MTEQELRVREKQEASPEEGTRAGRTYVPDVDIYETPAAPPQKPAKPDKP